MILRVEFYDFSAVDEKSLKFAVIMAEYNGKWIFVRHKDRNTWEIPGGHREENESAENAAVRELREETGAVDFDISPICVYSVITEHRDAPYTESFGGLYYAAIKELASLPVSEIAEIWITGEIPEALTYPMIQPYLFKKTQQYKVKRGEF